VSLGYQTIDLPALASFQNAGQAALSLALLAARQALGSRSPTASCLQNVSLYTSVPVIQGS